MGERPQPLYKDNFFTNVDIDLAMLRTKVENYNHLPMNIENVYANSIAIFLESLKDFYEEFVDLGTSDIDPMEIAEGYIQNTRRITENTLKANGLPIPKRSNLENSVIETREMFS